MTTVDSVVVNGVSLNLNTVEWQVLVTHGRNDITDSPQASNCQIILVGYTLIPAKIADTVVITAYGQTRFTGIVTDLELSHIVQPESQPIARLTINAMGNFSKLGLLNVGSAGYAEEALALRVDEIFAETGLSFTNNADPNLVVLPVAVNDGASALSWLSDLCLQTGATMSDLPNGQILFESYTRRGYDYNPATWAYLTGAWSTYPLDYDHVYQAASSAPVPVVLDNASVIWEPIWRNDITTIVNSVKVTYGATDPQLTVSSSDATSISSYGKRAYVLDTTISDPYDALTRAQNLITAQSEPRYDLQHLQIRLDQLTGTPRTNVLNLINGSRVQVTNLPQPAPQTSYLGIVEGWSETYTPDGHIITLSLSDPRYSYAMAQWISVSTSLTWGAVNGSIQWYNVIQPSDLN